MLIRKARWSPITNNIILFIKTIKKLIPEIHRKKQRGRKPKHSLREYLALIVTKEAEYSKLVCKRRVPKSTINYWEHKFDSNLIESLVKALGKKIESLIDYCFSILDSTKSTTWKKGLVE